MGGPGSKSLTQRTPREEEKGNTEKNKREKDKKANDSAINDKAAK
jgi:hypothetical protein